MKVELIVALFGVMIFSVLKVVAKRRSEEKAKVFDWRTVEMQMVGELILFV